jgi:hypothetical protein
MKVLRETLIKVGPLAFVRMKPAPGADFTPQALPPVIIDNEQSPATWRGACFIAKAATKARLLVPIEGGQPTGRPRRRGSTSGRSKASDREAGAPGLTVSVPNVGCDKRGDDLGDLVPRYRAVSGRVPCRIQPRGEACCAGLGPVESSAGS